MTAGAHPVPGSGFRSILSEINLGRDDADTDRELKNYFLETPVASRAISGEKWLVLGRKGTGKSAIHQMIPLLDSAALYVPITPDAYAWGTLKTYQETGVPLEHAHKNAWKFTLVSCVVGEFLEAYGAGRHLSAIKEFLFDNFGAANRLSFTAVSAKLAQKRIEELNLGPLGLKAADAALPPRILAALQVNLGRALEEKELRVRVSVDRLDDCWDGEADSRSLIVGLIKASQELNGELGPRLRVTVFLRTDIFGMLAFQDKDKVHQDELELSWNPTGLRDLVCQRVRFSAKLGNGPSSQEIWNLVFAKKLYQHSESALKYLVDRTFLRPRDILSLCRKAIETAIDQGHEAVEPEDSRTAFAAWSKSRLDDLVHTEFAVKYSFLGELLRAFRGSKHKLSRDEVNSILDAARIEAPGGPLKTFSNDQLMEILFETNAMGIYQIGGSGVSRGGSRNVYRYMEDNLSIHQPGAVFVLHPALYPALEVKLKYGPGEESESGQPATDTTPRPDTEE